MTDRDYLVCIYLLEEQIKCNLEREEIESVGVELPDRLRPDLEEVVLFLCGIPAETYVDEKNPGLCFDYLFDRWFDLVNEDSDIAPKKWIEFLLGEAKALQVEGHPSRQTIRW